MFDVIAAIFVILVLLTLLREYRRTRSITLLSLLTVGNVLYSAVTPAIFYYVPESAVIFEMYVFDAGMNIDESGLIRVMLAATLFQLVCMCVSFSGSQIRGNIYFDSISSKALVKYSTRVGWCLMLIGAVGVVWMGLAYNGNPWGLYEVSYFDRSGLSRQNSLASFMLLLGIQGASQLIVVFLLTDRAKMAVFILLMVTLHGLGMKSKFPVFSVLFVFLVVAIGRRRDVFRLLMPIALVGLILMTMSFLRGVDNLSDIPAYIAMNKEELGATTAAPWENDIPGPSSMAYFIINGNSIDFTFEPILEIVKLLVPKFVYDRGDMLADEWAKKMLGSQYQPGMGFGWSPICEGFLLAGWVGVILVAFVFARLARYVDDLKNNGGGKLQELSIIVSYSCAPLFLYAIRESMGGLVKQLLLVTLFVWMPTFLLTKKRKLQPYGRQEVL